MEGYLAALGRHLGKVDTDSGGLARYSLKLQMPPAINHDIEPEFSLEYCQGGPNGSLGVGWVLGGISCIRRSPSHLAYDAANSAPPSYDRSSPKLTLDGAELLNVSGEYGAQDAIYNTELDASGRSVSPLGTGFVVTDSAGSRAEYGTSNDSRVPGVEPGSAREWRLTKKSDYHGNTVTYTYTANPQTDNSSLDINTCYITSVCYTSNARTGLVGKRMIKFDYSSRKDVLVQYVQGVRCTWASLLTSIRIGVVQGQEFASTRAYELEYTTSTSTGDSFISSITETTSTDGRKKKLLPSTFGYTAPEVSPDKFFKVSADQMLPATMNNVALFTMNISGRCLADLACVRYESKINRMSIKTYLASTNSDGSITWTPSKGNGAEATLPPIDTKSGFPSILSPDLNNDGRADFVVPYQKSDGYLAFSISQSLGTGFQNAMPKFTDFKWSEGAKFMALDNPGRGPSVVQIFTGDKKKLNFRNFPSVIKDGKAELQDAITTVTTYDNTGTIDWLQLNHVGTGAKSLIRVWQEDLGMGQIQLKATAFMIDKDNKLKEFSTSLLGKPARSAQTKYTVLSCDLNADGVQDILLVTSEFINMQVVLSFLTFLGDGYGNFKMLGERTSRSVGADAPPKETDFGVFHVTNLNGSNYPTLSFVYQSMYSKSYSCISVDGQSDGSLSKPTLYKLTDKLLYDKLDVQAADLNGNGMGDWLFYTFENDIPRVIPVYNQSKVTDLLAWAQDPMGLRTELTYGFLSDPKVYDSDVKWDSYTNTSKDYYPIIAAPNYVVTKLQHLNNPAINSIKYNVAIKKRYSRARINFLGRGWQGFKEIHTLNETSGVLTTETYLQDWPLTGTKARIETKTPDGTVLKVVNTEHKTSWKSKGPWKVYRTDRTSEQTNMLEGDTTIRSNGVSYTYDDDGNMILRSPFEIQRGQLMHQSWDRCTYRTIDGVRNVLTARKLSANSNNFDMTKFEAGDVSLTLYENDTSRAILKSISIWSSDTQSFSKKLVTINDYGREARSIDAAGLTRTITYDSIFQTFPVKVMEQDSNTGVSTIEMTAFAIDSGLETAKLDKNGLLTCYLLDGFGRTTEIRARAVEQSQTTILGSSFLSGHPHVTDSSLTSLLSQSHLHPQRKVSFERVIGTEGAAYIVAKVVVYHKEGSDGDHELVEYLDCIKQVHKRSTRSGVQSNRTWTYWEHDSMGNPVYESFPVSISADQGPDWMPDKTAGIRSVIDILGRPTRRIRPAASQQARFIISEITYSDGGARVRENIMSSTDANTSSTNATQLAQVERRYIQVEKEELVVENKDENGLLSTFVYDICGRLIKAVDAAGQTETRSYNSQGQISTTSDPYQNAAQAAGTTPSRYSYNIAGHLIRETNAAGESIIYQRDAKGRATSKTGQDGRTIRCVYDEGGLEGLKSATIFSPKDIDAFESRLEFTYDHCGRVKERKLTIADAGTFSTSLDYDWQSQVVQKTLPNGVILSNVYRGSEIASRVLSGGSASNWNLKAETTRYNAYNKPEVMKIQGSAINDTFTHDWTYDAQGFTMTHGFRNNDKSLVDQRYVYNDLDQLSRKHDFLSGITTDYVYRGRRLFFSQVGSETVNQYAYDAGGNIISKRGIEVSHKPGQVRGTKNNQSMFEVTYDTAGRVRKRTTPTSALNLSYDSFGVLQSLQNTTKGQSVEFLADHNGEMMHRKQSDGSSDLFLGDDVTIHINSDGSQLMRYHLIDEDQATMQADVICTISMLYESRVSTRPLGGTRRLNVQFTDIKGNVTHVFNGENAELREKLEYDDFGLLNEENTGKLGEEACSTFEGNFLDDLSGLLNFRGRWYDPLIGRFIVPDDILDIGSLLRVDGLNRYVFENNDPINNIDPTGHWSWSAILGVIISVALVVAAIVVTVATGGAAAPLAAAVVGALASGGVAGIIYSVKHQDEEDAGKFWGGFATTVAINAAIGAATGAAGAIASPARFASAAARIAIKAFAGGAASVLTKAAERGVENQFYGTHHNLFEGWEKSFLTGALVGGAMGAISKGGKEAGGLKGAFDPKPSNSWLGVSAKEIMKQGGKAALKPGAKLASWGTVELGLDKEAKRSMGQMATNMGSNATRGGGNYSGSYLSRY